MTATPDTEDITLKTKTGSIVATFVTLLSCSVGLILLSVGVVAVVTPPPSGMYVSATPVYTAICLGLLLLPISAVLGFVTWRRRRTPVLAQPTSSSIPAGPTPSPVQTAAVVSSMPGNSALETMRVRTDGALVRVLVTASPIRDKEVEAVAASDIALDDTGLRQAQDELRGAKEALETANQQLQQSLAREETLARTDGLTGLCNRVYFEELAIREFHAAVRYQRALAIMMIDIDNFKRVNDTLGHAAGDEALRLLARAAAAHTRAADVIARLGGDEFVLLLPETTAQQALPIADRIVASVAATPIGDAADALAVTLSIGIAELRRKPMDDRVEQVVQRADRALYQAKADGRNRTRVFDSGTEDASALGKGRADRRHGRTGAQADGRARGTAGSGRRKRTERGKS